MNRNTGCQLSTIVIVLATFAQAAAGEERVWTNATGKFTVTAELVEVQRGEVVLRKADGQQITVPLNRLSDTDRAFVRQHLAGGAPRDNEAAGKMIAEIAETFYSILRSPDRAAARRSLTTKAQDLMKGGQSPLMGLPRPESGDRTIRVGRVQIDGTVAEVPVQVRAGGMQHKTKLHLRYEQDRWHVFALSAMYPDGERSINFEASVALQQNVDPLLALVGQRLELSGYTTSGRPLDMKQYKDKVVLVDFWATWCGPCRAEMPNVLANYEKYRDDGFDVIAISVDQDMKVLNTFVADEKPSWAVVADNHPRNRNSMAAKYSIRAIPAFILVGKDGMVVAVHCRGERLGQHLARLFRNGG